ncbi:hypothetical protein ILYODFUR_032036 [Ilyodon furcidens]|uniref:Uncharacterized protein n=1 Tax=Ilyodon furcidens TaxID=33524 RepID=A0ABV0UNM8_9TELE
MKPSPNMLLPSPYLHFDPLQPQTLTEGTSQYKDQVDKAKELKKWVRQQEEALRKRHGEEVEILPSPMLLQEMEEAEGRQSTSISPHFIPGRICSSLPPTASATSTRRRRHCRKPSSPPAASEPSSPPADSEPPASAASIELSRLMAAKVLFPTFNTALEVCLS